jgi:hypothetical protein
MFCCLVLMLMSSSYVYSFTPHLQLSRIPGLFTDLALSVGCTDFQNNLLCIATPVHTSCAAVLSSAVNMNANQISLLHIYVTSKWSYVALLRRAKAVFK